MVSKAKQVKELLAKPPHGVTAQALDASTLLLLLDDLQAQLLLILPSDESDPVLAIPRSLLHSLHCPNDLQFSEHPARLSNIAKQNPNIKKSGFIPIEPSSMMATPPQNGSASLKEMVTQIKDFIQTYSRPPSFPYRCPRLKGARVKSLILLLYFFVCFISGYTYKLLGDFFFHPYWISTTLNLPYQHWYSNISLNKDTQFHMDYPPLTGLFHYLEGRYIFRHLAPESTLLSTVDLDGLPLEGVPGHVNVNISLAQETEDAEGVRSLPLQSSRLHSSHWYYFLYRVVSILIDILLFGFAVFSVGQFFWKRINPRLRFFAAVLFLFSPVKLWIDHANIQINSIPVTLFLFSLRAALSSWFALSVFLGVLCVLTKHTFAILFIPFLVFIPARLSLLPSKSQAFFSLFKVVLIAVLTGLPVMLPFILSGTLPDIVHRLTPDTHAIQSLDLSFWIIVNSFIKIRYMKPGSFQWQLIKFLSLILPNIFGLPALYALYRKPSAHQFLRALQCYSLSFVAFCYQLNEKGIMLPLFSLHLTIFDCDPSLFFSIFLSSPIALRVPFSNQHELQDPMFFSTFVFFAPLLFLVYRFVNTISSTKAPKIPIKALLSSKIPVVTRILSLQRFLSFLCVMTFAIIQTLNLIFPRPKSLPYFWYVLDVHVMVLFWIACLFLVTLEMFVHPQAITVFESHHHLLKKPIDAQ